MSEQSYDPIHERQVLGAVLYAPWRIHDVARLLPPDAFADASSRAAYEAMLELHERGQPIQDEQVAVVLLDRTRAGRTALPEGGWRGFLFGALTESGGDLHLEHHVRWLREQLILRRARMLAGKVPDLLAGAAPCEGDTVAEAVGALQREVQGLSDAVAPPSGAIAADLADALGRELFEQRSAQAYRSTGIGAIDRHAKLYDGEFYVIGARTSAGKTALAVNLAMNVAEQGEPVVFFSTETKARGIVLRMLSRASGVDSAILRDGGLGDAYRRRVDEGVAALRKAATIDVQDAANLTPERMRAHVLRRTAEWGRKPGLVVVDYIQRVAFRAPPRMPRHEVVGEISARLQSLAFEADVPVVATAQLSREAEGIEPTLKHLRESGNMEQDADVVGLMWTDSMQADGSRVVKLDFAKVRNGSLGTATLAFSPQTFWFRSGGTDEHQL